MAGDSLGDQLAYLIASVNRRLEEELEERLRPEGVPIEQMRVLGCLAGGKERAEGCPMGELAESVLVDGPTLTKIIDRMVAESLVYRAPDPHDRRRVLIYVTHRGRALHRRLSGIARQQQKRLLERLDGAGADQLKDLLRNLMAG